MAMAMSVAYSSSWWQIIFMLAGLLALLLLSSIPPTNAEPRLSRNFVQANQTNSTCGDGICTPRDCMDGCAVDCFTLASTSFISATYMSLVVQDLCVLA